jgi:cobalt-zinc-cadmium efflux system outer membrane protein
MKPFRLLQVIACMVAGVAWLFGREAVAQGPTVEPSSVEATPRAMAAPGSFESLLGPRPGGIEFVLGAQPGSDEALLGRIGTAAPRVPTEITTPGIPALVPQPRGIAAPEPLPAPRAPLYGSLALPTEDEEAEAPSRGISLDEAIDRLLRENLDLRSRAVEIPQARADVLTASLRANPIFYADAQLVPYGNYSEQRPGGPTQYDINISYPIDYSQKRRARIAFATSVLRVTEAQYQDAVRLEINNLYGAFVDVLAARQTVRYARASVEGLQRLLEATRLLYEKDLASRADVNQILSQLQIAAVGVVDAEENLRKAARNLGSILWIPPEEAETLEVRGSIEDRAPPPPPIEDLVRLALECRPDVVAYRLGLQAARSGVGLAAANRYQDAYLLYQPYTFLDNSPYNRRSSHAWAVGLTIPLPVYNRNQGNLERARLNVEQSAIELRAIEQRVATEVRQAAREYQVSLEIVKRIRSEILPSAALVRDDRFRLFQSGEGTIVSYLESQRVYNETVKAYLDTAVRHRRSMLALNTAVGRRLLP